MNFLDINLNIRTGIFRPYMKENNTPLYVHKHSNHPPHVIKNIPLGVNKRLSSISSNQEVFNQAAKPYQDALENSGYDFKLIFEPPANMQKNRRSRTRKVTWFNPPFSMLVKTKVGQEFLKILDSSFPQRNPLHKLFNRNTVKISFKCMPNMSQSISRHNALLAKDTQEPLQPLKRTCNCRRGNPCPVSGQCKRGPSVYRAEVRADNKTEYYTGLSSDFNTRFYQHKGSFRKRSREHETTLSTHIWQLKEKNTDYEINWSLVDRATTFNHTKKKCNLCLKEKFHIMFKPENATLNKRSEFYSTCRHRTQNLLLNS